MRGEDPAAWSRALADPAWLASSQLLKDEPDSSWVRRATLNGRDVVVKCRYLNTRSRWLKSALGYGHGDKHWRGAALLASKKIPTARPVILLWARLDRQPVELLVLEHLPGPTLLQVLDAIARGQGPSVRIQHAIAVAAGSTIPAVLGAGLWNRDHKPSNLIVLNTDSPQPRIAIIDCVGIRRYGRLGIDELEGEDMAASLFIEPTGCGCPPRRALWLRALLAMFDSQALNAPRADRHADLRGTIAGLSDLIATHGDPRPRTDPLAPRGATA
jgi:hypothetical protein